jgi:hypothetical protein
MFMESPQTVRIYNLADRESIKEISKCEDGRL